MRNVIVVIPAALLLGGAALGQAPVFMVEPDAAPAGTPRNVTMVSTAPVSILCQNVLFFSVHANDAGRTQVGPMVPSCTLTSAPIVYQAGMGVTQPAPSSVIPTAPGTYWLRCRYFPGGGFVIGGDVTAWVDFRVDDPAGEPTLTAQAPTWNGPWTLTLSHPTDPAATYLAAASLSTMTRIDAGGGLFVSLDNDAIFGLSYPTPNSGLFSGFALATLSATGGATLIVNVPPDPGIGVQEVHVQAAVFPSAMSPSLVLTNCIDAAIQ